MKFRSIVYIALLFLTLVYSCIYKKQVDNVDNSITFGNVTEVVDGDTYILQLQDQGPVRIRMKGIDAPERGMPFSKAAKRYLKGLALRRTVYLEISDTDKYGRIIAYSYLENGDELSHKMVEHGYAWHYKKYSSDTTLERLQSKAKSLKRGIWIQAEPIPPWTIRELHRSGISTRDSFDWSSISNDNF